MIDLSQFENMDRLNREEKIEKAKIPDSYTLQSNQNRPSPEKRWSETIDGMMAHGFQSDKSCLRKEERTSLLGRYRENMSQDNKRAAAGERNETPQRPGEFGSGMCKLATRYPHASS